MGLPVGDGVAMSPTTAYPPKPMRSCQPSLHDATNVFPLSPVFSSASKPLSAPHVHDRNALNSFRFMRLRTTFFATEGWGSKGSYKSLSLYHSNLNATRTSPLIACLCFQRLAHCPICKPFVFITLQQYRGVGGPPFPFSLFHFPSGGSAYAAGSSMVTAAPLGWRFWA